MDTTIIIAILSLIGICVTAIISLISAVITGNIKKNSELTSYQISDIKEDIKTLQKKVDKTDDLEKRIIVLEENAKRG